MLLEKLTLIVANIQYILLSKATSIDSDHYYDDINPFENSQSEEVPVFSSEELQYHLNNKDGLVMLDLIDEKSNLDNPSDMQDYAKVMDTDEDNSKLIQILKGKKTPTVNANTPVLLDKHHFMGLEKVLEEISKRLNLTEDKEIGKNTNRNRKSDIAYRYKKRIPKFISIKDSKEENESFENDSNDKYGINYDNDEIQLQMLYKQYPFLNVLHNMNNKGKGLEKVLEEISKRLNLTEDKEIGKNTNRNRKSDITYRYKKRIPKFISIKDSKEENESFEDDSNDKYGINYENNEIQLQMLYKQYPFINALHNMNNKGKVSESMGNINKKRPVIHELGTILSTEQTVIHPENESKFENSHSNHDIDPYMIYKPIVENPILFVLDQPKDKSSMESQNIYEHQRQNNLFVLDQMAPTHIDGLQAIPTHSDVQDFILKDINSQIAYSETLDPYETYSDVLVNKGSLIRFDGDFLLEESEAINEPVSMFADDEMLTLDEIETQMELESKDSQKLISEISQKNNKIELEPFINSELHTLENEHIFTLEEFVSSMHAKVDDTIYQHNISYEDLFSNPSSSDNQEILIHEDKPIAPLDEQLFILESSSSLNESLHSHESPLISQLAINKIVTSAGNNLLSELGANPAMNEKDLFHLDKEPILYSLTNNDDIVNLDDPIKNKSISAVDSSYQTHIHKEVQLNSLHSKETKLRSDVQLSDKTKMNSTEKSDSSLVSIKVVQNAKRNSNENKIFNLTNEDQEREYDLFYLDFSNDDSGLEIMPVENISNHYEIKNNNKSYYLIKVEKRPDNYSDNLQNQSESLLALGEEHQTIKQEPFKKDILSVEQSENNSNERKKNKENVNEISNISGLNIYLSDEKDMNYKESRIFLTLDDVVQVLVDKFSDTLKPSE